MLKLSRVQAYVEWFWYGFTVGDLKWFARTQNMSQRQVKKLLLKWIEYDKISKGKCYYTGRDMYEEA